MRLTESNLRKMIEEEISTVETERLDEGLWDAMSVAARRLGRSVSDATSADTGMRTAEDKAKLHVELLKDLEISLRGLAREIEVYEDAPVKTIDVGNLKGAINSYLGVISGAKKSAEKMAAGQANLGVGKSVKGEMKKGEEARATGAWKDYVPSGERNRGSGSRIGSSGPGFKIR